MTLEWRRHSNPRALRTEAETILPDLDLYHVTLNEGQYVLWVNINEMAIKGYSIIHESLTTSGWLVQLGLAVMEKLSMLLMHAATSSDLHDYSASCVTEFKIHTIQNAKKGQQSFQGKYRQCPRGIGDIHSVSLSYYSGEGIHHQSS